MIDYVLCLFNKILSVRSILSGVSGPVGLGLPRVGGVVVVSVNVPVSKEADEVDGNSGCDQQREDQVAAYLKIKLWTTKN